MIIQSEVWSLPTDTSSSQRLLSLTATRTVNCAAKILKAHAPHGYSGRMRWLASSHIIILADLRGSIFLALQVFSCWRIRLDVLLSNGLVLLFARRPQVLAKLSTKKYITVYLGTTKWNYSPKVSGQNALNASTIGQSASFMLKVASKSNFHSAKE